MIRSFIVYAESFITMKRMWHNRLVLNLDDCSMKFTLMRLASQETYLTSC
jgi:hypothetical protein